MNVDGEHMSDDEMIELAAFADGSLSPAEHRRVAGMVQDSPRLQALVSRQRAAISVTSAIDAPAPAGLRERIAAAMPGAADSEAAGIDSNGAAETSAADAVTGSTNATGRSKSRRLKMPSLRFAGVVTAAAVAITVVTFGVIGLIGSSDPTVGETAELAQKGASSAAPAVDPANPKELTASVSGVSFPNYSEAFGWDQTGERSDDVEGRGTRTVFYESDGREIAYSIVEGDPLEWPSDNVSVETRDGVDFHQFTYDGRNVVTWLEGGHTCVLSSDQASHAELVKLASWESENSSAA